MVSDFSYQSWIPHETFKQVDQWLTLADLCMTFDPSKFTTLLSGVSSTVPLPNLIVAVGKMISKRFSPFDLYNQMRHLAPTVTTLIKLGLMVLLTKLMITVLNLKK